MEHVLFAGIATLSGSEHNQECLKLTRINERPHTFNPAIMQNRTVRQVVEDVYGNLWMGTQSLGLFKWTAAKARLNDSFGQGKIKFADGVSSFSQIRRYTNTKIILDKKGYVWVGTSRYGVFVIDPSNDQVMLHFGMNEPTPNENCHGTRCLLYCNTTTQPW